MKIGQFQVPAAVSVALRRERARQRSSILAWLVIGSIAAFDGWLVLVGSLDAWLDLMPAARPASIALLALLAVIPLAIARRRWSATHDCCRLASRLEGRHPRLAGTLQAAIDEGTRGNSHTSRALIDALFTEAADRLRVERATGSFAPMRGVAAALLLAVPVVAAASTATGRVALRRLVPGIDAPTWPGVPVAVPGNVTLVAGQSLRVNVATGSSTPRLEWQYDGGAVSTASMRREHDRFVFTLDEVHRPLSYRVIVARNASARYRVTIVQPLQLARVSARIDPPPALQIPPYTLAVSGGVLDVPSGVAVTFNVAGSGPMSRVTLDGRLGPRDATLAADRRSGSVDLLPGDGDRVRLRGVDAAGVSEDSATVQIRWHRDRRPAVETFISPIFLRLGSRLAVPYVASDDHAVTSVRVSIGIAGRVVLERDVAVRPQRVASGVLDVDLTPLGLRRERALSVSTVAFDGGGTASRPATFVAMLAPIDSDGFSLERLSAATRLLREQAEAGRFADDLRHAIGVADSSASSVLAAIADRAESGDRDGARRDLATWLEGEVTKESRAAEGIAMSQRPPFALAMSVLSHHWDDARSAATQAGAAPVIARRAAATGPLRHEPRLLAFRIARLREARPAQVLGLLRLASGAARGTVAGPSLAASAQMALGVPVIDDSELNLRRACEAALRVGDASSSRVFEAAWSLPESRETLLRVCGVMPEATTATEAGPRSAEEAAFRKALQRRGSPGE